VTAVAADATAVLKDTLGAASLVFSILSFFVGRRLTDYLAVPAPVPFTGTQWLPFLKDVVLGVAAPLFIAFVLLPVLRDSGAFGHFDSARNALPNLFAVVWAGFVLLSISAVGVLGNHVRLAYDWF
jgi:hypothetical protein